MPIREGRFEEPDNNDRAGWAASALEAYAAETRPIEEVSLSIGNEDDKEAFEEQLSDLLCDMHHLADKWGSDFDALMERGEGNYVEEVEEESLQEQ